jgi:hypothetical protein
MDYSNRSGVSWESTIFETRKPHEKVVKGVTLYRSKICNVWNSTHQTPEHDVPRKKQANLIEDTAEPDEEPIGKNTGEKSHTTGRCG